MIWHLEDPLRYRQERQKLEALASSAEWLVPLEWRIDTSLRVIWDADIIVSGDKFPISLRYPNHFPHSPPLVLPRGVTERWSSHQYGPGGELCLEFGPDNWHRDISGADMIESAHRLLQGERPAPEERGRVASRHATTLGQDLRGDRMRLLITRGLAEAINAIPEGETRIGTVICRFRGNAMYYIVKSVDVVEGQQWADETVPISIADEGVERPIVLGCWKIDQDLPPLASRTAFFDAVRAQGIELPDVNYVVLKRGERLHGFFLWKDDDSAAAISIIPAQPAAARLDESHAALKARKVAIVGCGSVGSKLAVMLARSGVGKFLLVDDDVMLPDNLVRHELDWREMGGHKVDGVARRIGLVNPGAECDTRQYRLGGQQSSGSIESLIETLAECDLIVDASADARVFNYLCAAVATGTKPLVWARIFGGGIGGFIARHRPGREPEPASMRRIIEQWCIDQGKPMPRARAGYETDGPGTPFIADDADVTVIAGHAARLAIDTLIPRDPSLFPNSVYMIGLAEGLFFDQPFDTRPIDVGPPEISVPIPVDQQIVDEERAHVLQLLKNLSDATSSDSTNNSTP